MRYSMHVFVDLLQRHRALRAEFDAASTPAEFDAIDVKLARLNRIIDRMQPWKHVDVDS